MEALFLAHDGAAAAITEDSPLTQPTPNLPSNRLVNNTNATQPATQTQENNIKIIKIEKTNEPLGKNLFLHTHSYVGAKFPYFPPIGHYFSSTLHRGIFQSPMRYQLCVNRTSPNE